MFCKTAVKLNEVLTLEMDNPSDKLSVQVWKLEWVADGYPSQADNSTS